MKRVYTEWDIKAEAHYRSEDVRLNKGNIFEPACVYVWWPQLHHFLSVWPCDSHQTKTQIGQTMKRLQLPALYIVAIA